jgi:hypothetical protein
MEGDARDNAPSNDFEAGMWNVVQSQANAYSAYEPPGAVISWKAFTPRVALMRRTLNSITSSPTSSTIPAISSPWFTPAFDLPMYESSLGPLYTAANSGTFQSLGLEPETMTLMSTCLALGEGMGADLILTLTSRPARLMSSFIMIDRVWRVVYNGFDDISKDLET